MMELAQSPKVGVCTSDGTQSDFIQLLQVGMKRFLGRGTKVHFGVQMNVHLKVPGITELVDTKA